MQKTKTSPIFLLGTILAGIGIAGWLWLTFLRPATRLAEILPSDTAAFLEFQISENLDDDAVDFADFLITKFEQQFGIEADFSTDIQPWIGSKIVVASLADGTPIFATKYRSRARLANFLDRFLLPGEKWQKSRLESAEIWTPAFSSEFAAGFFGKWVIFSPSATALEQIFSSTDHLASSPRFSKISRDRPTNPQFFAFLDTALASDAWLRDPKFAPQKPLAEATAAAIPAAGIFAEIKDGKIAVRAKVLTHEGVFSGAEIHKTPNSTMPALARFAPRDILFFTNGTDLWAKYAHTKKFLARLHPQFALIFDGILRGWARENFGEKFNFETDFLAKMRGQYAILVDFEDATLPFLNFSLITGFGSADIEQNLSDLHEAIRFAQAQFSTRTETVELPDGTAREEFVAVDKSEIPIEKNEASGRPYFTTRNSATDKSFSYGFIENFLVFTSHESAIRSIFAVADDPASSLAENADFRKSVLFEFTPSESYGFTNFAKLESATAFLAGTAAESSKSPRLLQILRTRIRNLTFSRKVFPDAVFWSAVLFLK